MYFCRCVAQKWRHDVAQITDNFSTQATTKKPTTLTIARRMWENPRIDTPNAAPVMRGRFHGIFAN